eukprot:Selendium_serpulae@DN4180_c0_g1_i2.p2
MEEKLNEQKKTFAAERQQLREVADGIEAELRAVVDRHQVSTASQKEQLVELQRLCEEREQQYLDANKDVDDLQADRDQIVQDLEGQLKKQKKQLEELQNVCDEREKQCFDANKDVDDLQADR